MKQAKFNLSMLSMALLVSGAPQLMAQEAPREEGVEVIMVSAQKRVQRIIDVPTSIAAIGGELAQKSGAQQLGDIEDLVTNLDVEDFNSFNNAVYIRGVGAHSRQISFDTRVGVYLDGVYLGQSPALNQQLMDIQSIEVLRGPQGSLFGRNTVAGAINIITKKPSDYTEGAIRASLGNYQAKNLSGYFNTALSDDVFFKLTANMSKRDGFVDNVTQGAQVDFGNKDSRNVRGQLQIDSFDDLSLLLTLDAADADENPLFGEHITDVSGSTAIEEAGVPIRQTTNDVVNREQRKSNGISLTAEYDLANGGAFKSITANRNTELDVFWDLDYSSLRFMDINYVDEYEQFTQEFQYTSPNDDTFEYILGFYYYNQSAYTNRRVIPKQDIRTIMDRTFLAGLVNQLTTGGVISPEPGVPALNGTQFEFLYPSADITHKGDVDTESYALFGNFTYSFAQDWQLGIGLRFEKETRDVDWTVDGSKSGAFNITSHNLVDEISDTVLLPSVSLNYDVNRNTVAYLRYAQGSKSGGFNLDFINANQLNALTFEPETSTNIELGIKGQLDSSGLRYALAVFDTVYDDYQQSQFIEVNGANGESTTIIAISNAAEASTMGLEAELSGDLTDKLSFTASFSLLDAEFDYFPNGGTTAAPDVTGNRLPLAAEKQASIALDYVDTFELGEWFAHLSLAYTGDMFTTNNNVRSQTIRDGSEVPFGYLPARTTVNARLGVDINNWNLSIWARNLFDRDEVVFSRREFFGGINQGWNAPRTFGIETTYRF